MNAVLLKLFYDGAAQGFAGCVKSRTILLHPINTPQAVIPNMAGMRFRENLHPTHSHSWRPQLENQGHTHMHKITHTHSVTLCLALSVSQTRFAFHSLSPAHTRIFSYTRGTDFTAAVSVKTQWLSVQPRYIRIWRSVCSNVWGTIAAKNERDGEKTCIRKKDSRKREWGRERREDVIATELTHIESNGSWGFWKISQRPRPFSPSYDASIYSLQWEPDTCRGIPYTKQAS